ncbi:glycosyltransferase family 2 protein [Acidothermaceae bacterium B102]|nr:glycosyltransferase family 2 protein [Acidothermaceae bacterium B102]
MPGRTRLLDHVLIAVPAFGAAHLTDAVVSDLLRDGADRLPNSRIVVIDNRGDYVAAATDDRLSVHRPGSNLKWIGSANWALDSAREHGDSICLVLNNDTRLSPDFAYWLASAFADCTDVAVAAACYDDFWLHQRAHVIPDQAADYQPIRAYRQVPFCDGTAIAFSTEAAKLLGGLDQEAFPHQGYGADIDYALRARAYGLRCLVSDAAYVHHLRRGTMQLIPEETGEAHRHEILTGLDAKWGPGWRAQAGLSDDSFPAHNKGSASSWYL